MNEYSFATNVSRLAVSYQLSAVGNGQPRHKIRTDRSDPNDLYEADGLQLTAYSPYSQNETPMLKNSGNPMRIVSATRSLKWYRATNPASG
jgi:hypothetical protein